MSKGTKYENIIPMTSCNVMIPANLKAALLEMRNDLSQKQARNIPLGEFITVALLAKYPELAEKTSGDARTRASDN